MTESKEKTDNDSQSIDTNDAIEELFGFQMHDMAQSFQDDDSSHGYGEQQQEKQQQHSTITANSMNQLSMENDNFRKQGKYTQILVEPVELPPNCYRRANEPALSTTPSLLTPPPPPPPPTALYIHNVLNQHECENLIQIAKQTPRGFQYIKEASYIDPSGTEHSIPLQKPHPHKLSLFQNPYMVNLIWKRLYPILNDYLSEDFRNEFGCPLGLNPRLRILRYDANDDDHFSPHYDATTTTTTTTTNNTTNAVSTGSKMSSLQNKTNSTSNDEAKKELQSQLTVLLYLNHNFKGGRTLFLNRSDISRNIRPVNPQQGSILLFDHGLYHSGEAVSSANETKYILRTDVMFASPSNERDLHGPESAGDESNHLNIDSIPLCDNTKLKHTSNAGQSSNESKIENENDSASISSSIFQQPSPTPQLNTIDQICLHIKIPPDEIQMLEVSGMLDSTVDSFCSPGRERITMILKETTSMSKESIEHLVNESFQIVKRQ